MPSALILPLAASAAEPFQVGRPLFGSVGLALALVLAGIAAFLFLVALLGRWLAATHPAPPPIPVVVATLVPPTCVRPAPSVGAEVPAEVVSVVLATVAEMFGSGARVASIQRAAAAPLRLPSIEALMQEWSHEARRQIYSSHKVR